MKNNDSPSSSLYSRRDFLKTSATVAGAYVASSSIPTLHAATAPDYGAKKLPFALQLYTIGRDASTDPEGTFAKLKSLGLSGVEFAGYLGKDAPTLRKILDDAGLKAVGSHVPGGASALQGDNLKVQIEFNQILGNPRLIVASGATGMAAGGGRGRGAAALPGATADQQTAFAAMNTALADRNAAVTAARTGLAQAAFSDPASIPDRLRELSRLEGVLAAARADELAKIQSSPQRFNAEQIQSLVSSALPPAPAGGGARAGGRAGGSATTRETMIAAANGFNAAADILKPLNMFCGYHCHPQDFTLIDGTPEWDVLFSNTKPEVIMQIDLGHMGTAGMDQPTYMAHYPGRAKTVHVKPEHGGGGKLVGDPNDANDWPAIFKACESVGGTEWYVIEYDGGNMGMVERTMARMKEWGKV